MSALHSHWIWPRALGTVAVGILAWVFRRTAPTALAALLIVVAGLLPVLGLVRFDFQDYSTVADHYLYLSMPGIALAAAWIISRVSARAATVAATAVLTVLAARSWLQTLHWKDSITLFEHTLRVNRESAAACNSIAGHLLAEHDLSNAIAYARSSVQLRPDRIIGYVTLAQALTQAGRPDEAIACLQAGRDANPGNAVFLSTLAGVLARSGRLDEALHMALQAVSMQPDLADARLALGSILMLKGDYPDAVVELETAVRLGPAVAAAQANLGHALEAAGHAGEAIAHYRMAVRVDPELKDAQTALDRLSGISPARH